jgi:hypothetical protein
MRTTTLLVFAFVIGCGGNDVGSVSGTVHGMSIPVSDAISASVTTTVNGLTVHSALIVIASSANLCADAMTNTSHPNEKGVILSLSDITGTTFTTPTAPGSYAIYQSGGSPPMKAATLTVSVSDATCKTVDASGAKATTGTVTLSAVSGNAFDGSFDVALDSGDHITGSFTPEECPTLQTLVTTATQGPCT